MTDADPRKVLASLAGGGTLSALEMRDAVSAMLRGDWTEVEVAALLAILRIRSETTDELIGAATALREAAVSPLAAMSRLLDSCGTGGDRLGTFNISTATAIVVAACGVPVAKHGNRSVSSTSGSADVLAALGVHTLADPVSVSRCLDRCGLAFFFAPNWHPAVAKVQPIRRQLGFRTIFNLLGPLCNPAGASFQLIGVGAPDWEDPLVERMAAAAAALGVEGATVVAGSDGLDEVTLAGPTKAIRIERGELRIEYWTPAMFGLPSWSTEAMRVASPDESAAAIRSVLADVVGPHRDIVLANAAACLLTAGEVVSLADGVARATAAIESGAAADRLAQLVHWSNAT